MFAGVATGVSSAAEATTFNDISTGRAETSSSAAADTAIGMTTRIGGRVADELAEHGGQDEQRDQQRVGAGVPTMSTSRSASLSAAPLAVIAVDSGIIPATSTTVVHEMAR